MKTTIDIPDALFRQAKPAAAERGVSLRLLISEALREKLRAQGSEDKPWMKSFSQLRHLHKETARINKIIEAESRDELKRAGRPIPPNDLWIAALARQHALPLLSRDQHFDYVPQLKRISW